MKEKRSRAKDGPDADPMKEMRDRYERAVEAEIANRDLAREDLRFVTVPGNQWDEKQKKARRNRPCYEFPILRSHWRQVVNDQKKARPGIKVRAVEDGDAKGAELRQGIIRNIESMSNAERAYDSAFETLTACGFGAWRVTTEYSDDDGWDQDIRIRPIKDPLNSVWMDPENPARPKWGFVEEDMLRSDFKARWPDAECADFESARNDTLQGWFGEDTVRVAEYHREVPVTKTLVLLSDGRTVDKAELDEQAVMQLMQQGITAVRERECHGTKVVMSIVSGAEELEGPFDSVFDRVPIVTAYANHFYIDGKWVWAGMVRFSRDPQKLLNYNLTTATEVLAKQHKATPLVTPKMLEGKGVKEMWDASGAVDMPYLPYTPDPAAPNARPDFLSPPPIHQAFAQMAQVSTDMLKASDGIFDASVGARSNETSGKAIMARQQEGDTATFDYRDALTFAIQTTGEIVLSALPKVYDTPRAMRVLGKDGGEDWQQINQPGPDGKVLNDLSAGKYDVTVTTGPAYDTQRMEFVEMLTQLGQNNPAIAAGVPDLIVGALDFPKAEEAAERMKLLLPPPVAQALQQKDQSPAVTQLKAQMEQMQQQFQMQAQEMQQAMSQLQAKANSQDAAQMKEINAAKDRELEWFDAVTRRLVALQNNAQASAELDLAAASEAADHIQTHLDREHEVNMAQMQADQQAQAQAQDQAHQQEMASQPPE